ncbi:MAG: hypothetical protein AAFV72_06585 [Cyanobacteria bacterium J06635_1]
MDSSLMDSTQVIGWMGAIAPTQFVIVPPNEADNFDTPLPSLTGHYGVGTQFFDFVDPTRPTIFTPYPTDSRALTVQIWYPSLPLSQGRPTSYLSEATAQAYGHQLKLPPDIIQDVVEEATSIFTHAYLDAPLAATDKPYPVIFFSPGLGVMREFYTSQAEQLASHGYVVVSLSHPYNAPVTEFADGRIVRQRWDAQETDRNFLDQDALTNYMQLRATDAQFILDQLTQWNQQNTTANPFAGSLDLDHVGMFGHDLGGATTAEVMRVDPRFKAGLNVDGNLLGGGDDHGLERPFMSINAGLRDRLPPDDLSPDRPIDARRVSAQRSFLDPLKGDGYCLTVAGARHNDFFDLPLLELEPDGGFGTLPLGRATEITQAYTLAFFERYLKHQPQALLTGPSRAYPEVEILIRADQTKSIQTKSVPKPNVFMSMLASIGTFLHRRGAFYKMLM